MTNHKSNLKLVILYFLKNNTLNRDVLEKIIDIYIINSVSMTDACIENWSLAIYKLTKNNIKINHKHIETMTENGNLEIIKYFNENWTLLYDKNNIYKFDWNNKIIHDKSLIDIACSKGHLEIVKYLFEHKTHPLWCTTDAMDSAIENGRLDIVKYLASKNVKGTYDSVKQLYENSLFDINNELLDYVNNNQHLFLINIYKNMKFYFNY